MGDAYQHRGHVYFPTSPNDVNNSETGHRLQPPDFFNRSLINTDVQDPVLGIALYLQSSQKGNIEQKPATVLNIRK